MDNKQINIPDENAGWSEIQNYALSFNAYEYWNGTSKAAQIANQQRTRYHIEDKLTNNLIELKTCLFIEQRRFHHYGWAPSEKEMVYISALLEKIRSIEEVED